jgi:SAM-dependent MidA family methyltransferase
VAPGIDEHLRRYFPPPEENRWYEVNLDALKWLERIGRSLKDGYLVTVDYGYTRAEWVRFPTGTLMGYRRHVARENILEEPGERDITAHVNFTALEEAGERLGLKREIFETLAKILLLAGEPDQFAEALGGNPETGLARRMQLKTLLFGMGETFRVLVQRREVQK